IDLLYKYDKVYFPQLVFGPMLDVLHNPQIVVNKDDIVLRNAVLPGSDKKTDIDIPLASDGTMLINWPPKNFNNSFRHLSYYNLLYHDHLLSDLLHNLGAMQQAGYFSVWTGSTPLMQPYTDAEAVKQELYKNPTDELRQAYRDDRKLFFQQVGEYLNGSAEGDIQQQIDSVLATPNLAADQKTYYQGLKTDVKSFFGSSQEIYKKLMDVRATLAKALPNAFIIIGWTSTSTTDIGVNPFDEKYVNVGTHASVFNTIIQQKFLDHEEWWVAIVIAALFSFLVSLVIRNMAGGPSIAVGLTATALVILGISLYFIFTGVYINLLTPTVSVALTFVILTIIKFLRVGREKAFLRNAFNHYLSPDVITQIVNDPNSLSLGGKRAELTALFTDVQKFSTLSEQMDPEDLVRLLNRYLGEMSDAILAERGTIDKYEGDAIISFFGAPVNIGNHAVNACRSALKMKELEAKMNIEFLETKASPSALLTRIGINTGEMVVGNMGTLNRMDYTMMGNNVNLAARLEGVNKQYGTWILISEATYRATDRAFSIRKLDRVRVVGISEPIRLYELIGERETVDQDEKIINKLRLFNGGLNLFEEKKYPEAEREFQKVVELYPEDGPTKYYLDRCQAFRKKPPAPEWDGVFNLATK
ncbi:MAG TPA: adenylate/guanylate cyclase domain-containing protein, partial [Spirochaetia bacterium]|nr:adenylate/guanylate cyclase domain-containing protein [Spirochaetia bacterium]